MKYLSIEYINTFTCLEIRGKSNLKCYVEEVVALGIMDLGIPLGNHKVQTKNLLKLIV